MSRSPHHGVSDEKKARISAIAKGDPDLTILQIRDRCGVSESMVRAILGPDECKRRRTRRGS